MSQNRRRVPHWLLSCGDGDIPKLPMGEDLLAINQWARSGVCGRARSRFRAPTEASSEQGRKNPQAKDPAKARLLPDSEGFCYAKLFQRAWSEEGFFPSAQLHCVSPPSFCTTGAAEVFVDSAGGVRFLRVLQESGGRAQHVVSLWEERRGQKFPLACFVRCGAAGEAAGMSQKERPTFYRQELNKTVWEVPERYQNLSPVGSGAYGSVWWVAICRESDERKQHDCTTTDWDF